MVLTVPKFLRITAPNALLSGRNQIPSRVKIKQPTFASNRKESSAYDKNLAK